MVRIFLALSLLVLTTSIADARPRLFKRFAPQSQQSQPQQPQSTCRNGVCSVPQATDGTDAAEVVNLINQHRAHSGAGPLALDSTITTYAESWSHTMTRTGLRHSSGWVQFGGLEVIGHGHSSPADIVRGWMNSPGHRNAILSPSVTRFGLGRVGSMWTGVTGR